MKRMHIFHDFCIPRKNICLHSFFVERKSIDSFLLSVCLRTDPWGKQCAAVRTQQGEMRLPPQVNALPRDLLLNTAAIQGWSSTALRAPPTTFMLRSSLWPHRQPEHTRDRAVNQTHTAQLHSRQQIKWSHSHLSDCQRSDQTLQISEGQNHSIIHTAFIINTDTEWYYIHRGKRTESVQESLAQRGISQSSFMIPDGVWTKHHGLRL